jgi:hypothetical protein
LHHLHRCNKAKYCNEYSERPNLQTLLRVQEKHHIQCATQP